jgi:hypothetical protein
MLQPLPHLRLKPVVVAVKYACYSIGHYWVNTQPGREVGK